MDPGAYDDADMPSWRASDGRGGPPGGRRYRRDGPSSGLPGILRFFLFAGILAVVVVVAGLTVMRPLVRAAVVGWAWDNPGSLRISIVADFIREDLGRVLTNPASTDESEIVFEVVFGDTPTTIAPRLLAAGTITSERAFLFAAVEQEIAALNEYNLALGRVLTETVEPPTVDAETNALKLEPAAKMMSNKRTREQAKAALDEFARVIEAHPDTPWAALAETARDRPLGLSWVPTKVEGPKAKEK